MKYTNLVGQKFGYLVVLAIVEKVKGETYWLLCKCVCGTEWKVRVNELKRRDGKSTVSCGCMRGKRLGTYMRKHGLTDTPEYRIWKSLRRRCTNPTRKDFRFYGAKGITVCERWNNFENFIADMGPRPEGLTLDRIDNSGNYTPENCRWATWTTQFANRPNLGNTATMVMINHNGETHSVSEWGRITGFGKTLASRIFRGWSIERALSEPIHSKS